MVYSARFLTPRTLMTVPLRRHKRTMATAATVVTKKRAQISLWKLYQENLDRRPLLTKAVMASFIFFASDSATQYILPGDNNLVAAEAPGAEPVWRWDASRALSGAGFGVVATSWLHYWWGFLETAVGRAVPAHRSRLANSLTKVALDQLLGESLGHCMNYYLLPRFSNSLVYCIV